MTDTSNLDPTQPIEPATVPASGAASTSVDPAPEVGFKFDAIDPPYNVLAE
jgi:hypothetical protein